MDTLSLHDALPICEDLMSRVSYSMMNPGGDLEMTDAVHGAINVLIEIGRAHV